MITENLDTFLSDFGVAVVLGSVSGLGILDQPDQTLGGGLVQSTQYALTAKASVVGGAKAGDPITVGGIAYKVREVTKLDDGAFCRLLLSAV